MCKVSGAAGEFCGSISKTKRKTGARKMPNMTAAFFTVLYGEERMRMVK